MRKVTDRRSFFFRIAASLAIGFLMAPLCALTPREALDAARAAKDPTESAKILSSALPTAGDLRPWFLLDLARYSGESGKWEESLARSQELQSMPIPSEIRDLAVWWLSEALSRRGRQKEAAASCLKRIKTGEVRDVSVYLSFFNLAEADTEYALNAFDRAFPELRKTDPASFALTRYAAGLCAVREGAWAIASGALAAYSSGYRQYLPAYAPWAQYYLALSLYRQGKWAESVAEFSTYLNTWKNHQFSWQAATSAALASIQAKGDPLPYATLASSLAPIGEDRAASIILESSILIDRKRLSDAETLLATVADGTATGGITSKSPRAVFMLAEIAARRRDSGRAEGLWLSIRERYPKDPLAEEAVYRAAEQWYVSGEWKRASSLFASYRQTWPKGRFLDSVLRGGGDALMRDGNADLAILWWEDLAAKFPASPATPRTLADLVSAYRKKAEFPNALRVAREYQKKYPEEARLDGMNGEIAELESLASGGQSDVVALELAYRDAGKAKTPEGRAEGVRLARRYMEDWGKRADAKAILLEITAKAPRSPDSLSAQERTTFGLAWSLLGSLSREAGEGKSAAASMLAAGTMYAAVDADRAAESLYGAVDGFLQTGLRADAERTAETIARNWPDSPWSRRAAHLLE